MPIWWSLNTISQWKGTRTPRENTARMRQPNRIWNSADLIKCLIKFLLQINGTKKEREEHFPGGPVVDSPPANVQTLIWEDSRHQRATKPVRHNYWSLGALEPACHKYWGHVPQLLKPTDPEPVFHNKRSHSNWETRALQQTADPACHN